MTAVNRNKELLFVDVISSMRNSLLEGRSVRPTRLSGNVCTQKGINHVTLGTSREEKGG